jgi:fatty-acyl-CoA synthase
VSAVPTLLSTILDHAAASPEHIFAHILDRQLNDTPMSYSELVQRAKVLAGHLQSIGVQPDEVVIVILQPGSDLLCAFVAPLLIGAIPSIFPWPTEKLGPEYYRGSVRALVEISEGAAICVYPQLAAELQSLVGSTQTLRGIIAVAPDLGGSPIEQVHPTLLTDPDRITLLQHSSGSTGLQKGVALSSRALHNQIESYADCLALNSSDVIVSWLPLYHDMGLIAGFMLPLVKRVPVVSLSPIDWVRHPASLLIAIDRYRGTLCWLPNFAYNFCAQKIPDRLLTDLDLSSMRAFVNCSEPVRVESHNLFLDRFKPLGLKAEALTTSYAMAENTFAVTQSPLNGSPRVDQIDRAAFAQGLAVPSEDPAGLQLLSSGQPIAGTEIRIVDADRRDLADRHIGEIALRSNCMLSGYYHRPDLTAQAIQDGWYFTGDLGYLVDGELWVTGRQKDLIIVGGKNIYPQDLEAIVDQVPGVHAGRSVAFGLFNAQTGTEEVVIIAEVDRLETAREIQDAIRDHIAHESDTTVKVVKCVDRQWLIKTSSGKVVRSACKTKFTHELSGK